MKKIIFTGFVLATLIASVFVSCNKQKCGPLSETSTTPQSISEDYRSVEFVNFSKNNLSATARGIVICSWEEWGRESKKCKSWGLCLFTWFPNEEASRYSAPIVRDGNGNYYLEILFAASRPTSSDFDNLPIDADILVNTESSIIGRNLVAKAGTYSYDSTMGTYGGYKIWLI